MLTVHEKTDSASSATEQLVLPYESRCKRRMRSKLQSGEEIALMLASGTILRGGDFLAGDDGRVIAVIAASEALIEARCTTPLQLGRVAYHLGNRHVAVEVGDDWLRFVADHVLAQMVQGLGCATRAINAAFEPEAGAYGAHAHEQNHSNVRLFDPGHGAHRSLPKIHEFPSS
ncbi:urease accessory protein UreE [Pseudolysobacter antarcticus]|uniref:Urease accessory protein UreE n=1 Tax=Pseudolysobacter antarcticus TaxID=2511995 RepID=A0A411HJJ9_9GAMM|nr:urease accessory protein UreE [Pseudolysobacter antarcticus]QBB70685.1 urease accessory protein UreE [Pseudolysobacter antarcticus]